MLAQRFSLPELDSPWRSIAARFATNFYIASDLIKAHAVIVGRRFATRPESLDGWVTFSVSVLGKRVADLLLSLFA